MQPNNSPEEIYEAIKRSRRIALVSHRRPDGDTLGANLGFYHWLLTLREKREIVIFCVDTPSSLYMFLPGRSILQNDLAIWDKPFDLIATFDAGDLTITEVAGKINKQQEFGALLIDFDHHITNPRFGDLNYVLTEAASSTEVIYHFIIANAGRVTSAGATCLLAGLVTDTGFFSNPATQAKALAVARELVALGADYPLIQEKFLKDKNLFALQLWGVILERLTYQAEYELAWTYVTKDELALMPKDVDVTDGLSNFLNDTLNLPAILVVKEKPDGLSGSLRSSAKINVASLAKQLGGGGHTRAAGFFIEGARLVVDDDGCRVE